MMLIHRLWLGTFAYRVQIAHSGAAYLHYLHQSQLEFAVSFDWNYEIEAENYLPYLCTSVANFHIILLM